MWPRQHPEVRFVDAGSGRLRRADGRDSSRSGRLEGYFQYRAGTEKSRPRARRIAGSPAAAWAGAAELPLGGRDNAWTLDDRRAIRSQAMDARKTAKKAGARQRLKSKPRRAPIPSRVS